MDEETKEPETDAANGEPRNRAERRAGLSARKGAQTSHQAAKGQRVARSIKRLK